MWQYKHGKNGVNINSTISIFSVNSDENLNGLQKVYAWYQSNRNTLHTKPVRKCYNSLVVARQNMPITSIHTDFTLGSWKDFDVDLKLISSKEIVK